MKGRQFERLTRLYLLPYLPGFEVRRKTLIATPMEWLLRAFEFESSSFDPDDFAVSVFVQPLYAPSPFIHFGFGDRLGKLGGGPEIWWSLKEDNQADVMADVLKHIKVEGLPFLQMLREPADLVKWIKKRSWWSGHPTALEAVAYSLVLIGQLDQAWPVFDRLDNIILGQIAEYPDEDWYREVRDRARLLRSLAKADQSSAVALLGEWKDQTAGNLKLDIHKMQHSDLH